MIPREIRRHLEILGRSADIRLCTDWPVISDANAEDPSTFVTVRIY